MNPVAKRYDFVLLFDVKDGNPNGDPDAGNLPRIDAETGMGLVTDVCLKRKVRNFVQLTKADQEFFGIYIKEKAVLGRAQKEAFDKLGIDLGEESRLPVDNKLLEALSEFALPEGMALEEEENGSVLVVAGDADVKSIKQSLRESKPPQIIKAFLEGSLKGVKARKPTSPEVERGREWMCKNYYDIRTFGAVMSLKSAPNCGQVRGPVQVTFSRSVEPVIAIEHSITRMAVATEKEAEKQSGENRTMGRKYTIPYGLYRTHGFVSAHLAAQTGFSQEDLDLFWKALQEMFEHDHSAARGLMSTRRLIVFEHSTALGNKPAQELFARVTFERMTKGPARDFSDYQIQLDGKPLQETFTIVPVA